MPKQKTAPKFEIANIERKLISYMKKDVDLLCKQFISKETFTLETFADLFVAKEFSTIFLGRLAISELIEFVENLLLHCARYITPNMSDSVSKLDPASAIEDYPSYVTSRSKPNRAYDLIRLRLRNQKRTIPERIFGVYMSYCLYFLQPSNYVTPIRVSVRQMDEIRRFAHDVLIVEEHAEALFCLFRLVDGGAFSVTPFESEFNPLLHRRFDAYDDEGVATMDLSELEVTEDFPMLNQLNDDITLKQLSAIHDAYRKMKEACNLPEIADLGVDASTDVAGYVKKLLNDTMTAFAEECRPNKVLAATNRDGAEASARYRRNRIRQSAYASTSAALHFRSRRQNPDEASTSRAAEDAQPPMWPIAGSSKAGKNDKIPSAKRSHKSVMIVKKETRRNTEDEIISTFSKRESTRLKSKQRCKLEIDTDDTTE